MLRSVNSGYLNRTVIINDDCGCEDGGFYEKEFTEHGFQGTERPIAVKVYCDKCGKELPMQELETTVQG